LVLGRLAAENMPNFKNLAYLSPKNVAIVVPFRLDIPE